MIAAIVAAAALAAVAGFAAAFALFRSRWKFEYAQLEASLQHERYAGRLSADFVHALSSTFAAGTPGEHEISRMTVFESVLRTAVRGTRAMSACIFMVNPADKNTLVPVKMSGLFPFLDGFPAELRGVPRRDVVRALFHGKNYDARHSVFAPLIEQRRAGLVNAFPPREGTIALPQAPTFPRSLLVAPFFVETELSGIVAIANPRHGGQFTPAELHLAEVLGEQIATALRMRKLFSVEAEKARLDRELGLAGSIQKLLLPQYIPQAHSLEISKIYRPAQKIGGDLYDVFDLGGGRIAAIVADVSGHGISAALLMALCRTSFQFLAQTAISAADLLRSLNRAMMHNFKRGMFTTIACAFIDTQRNTISVARAGHERPILISNHFYEKGKEPEIEILDSKGLAVGIAKPEIFDAALTEISRNFTRGDVLVFYTDGLTESVDRHGEEFGTDRLRSVLRANISRSAEQINNAILEKLNAFAAGTGTTDDLTLVTIRSI